jgi:integrase
MNWTESYFRVWAPVGFEGNRERKAYYFKTKNSAKEFKIQVNRWKAAQKLPSLTLHFTESDKQWIAYLRAHVGDLAQLPAIVAHWEATAKGIRETLSVTELCNRFIAARTGRVDKSTLADDKFVCRRLIAAVGQLKANELGAVDVRKFLDSATTDSTARKFYKIGSLVFKFAREHRNVILNPFDEIPRPRVRYVEPGILTPAQLKKLLIAAAPFPHVLAFLALAGFAGLRREELLKEYADDEVLKWEDINFEKDLITVRAEVAKRTSRKGGDKRYVPIESALSEWLSLHVNGNAQKTGNLIEIGDATFRRQWAKVCKATSVRPPPNALRHSFASYWLARSESAGVGRLAVIMGNSESVVRRHYLEVLSPEDGRAWFGLSPQSASLSASAIASDRASNAARSLASLGA